MSKSNEVPLDLCKNKHFRDLSGDYSERAFEYEAGPYVDAGPLRFSAGVRGFGQIQAEAGRVSGFITADSNGDEHRAELGVTIRL